MTEFISRKYGEDGFEVIIKTNAEEHYKAAEAFARRLIDHAKPQTNADRIREMANEKRLIYADKLKQRIIAYATRCNATYLTVDNIIMLLNQADTVDAVPVKDIKLLHILIDNEGVPEVKLRFGDRFVLLRTDPVDWAEVKHGDWVDGRPYVNSRWRVCSVCHASAPEPHGGYNFCPNCGAKMDGEAG